VNQLHEVANETHNSKPDSDSSADLEVFFLIRLRTPRKELVSLFKELLWNLHELFDLVRHLKGSERWSVGGVWSSEELRIQQETDADRTKDL